MLALIVGRAGFKQEAGRFSTITSADVRCIGKDPSLTVHLPHNPDAHIILPTVVHQIHCLDSIRKMVFHDHYFPHGSNSPLHWDHLQHCIGLVLDGLRCASSVDPIVMNWMQDQEGPVLDFDISMKCRDHDAFLREWGPRIVWTPMKLPR
jgi:hypothetical protein